MTTLRFDLPLRSADLQNIDVPVEVRDLKMRLIAETTASGSADVPAGRRYVVTARLPAGQTIAEFVDADSDVVTVALSFEEKEPVEEWQEVPTYFASPRAQRASELACRREATGPFLGLESESFDLTSAIGEPFLPQATLQIFAGNVLGGQAGPIPFQPERRTSSQTLAELVAPPAAEPRWLHCRHADGTTINIALPVSGSRGCTIAIHREATRYWLEVHPRHQQANLLLSYAQNRLPDDEAKLAERLLLEKMDDPIAAAVGAYSLLRVSSLSRLHDWTGNLMDWNPWLPDGAAVRGEHLARMGRHEEAFEAFVQVTERGLPVFSDGARFTYDRLRMYLDEESGLPQAHARVAEVRRRLRRFIKAIDFTKRLTTFEGADPNSPKSTSNDAALPAGLEVATLFAGRT